MNHLIELNNTSIPYQEISTLYISHVNSYFKKFEDLKNIENWKQIILLGELALTDKSASFPQMAKIHAQLASCYFYLGEYCSSSEHAHKCELVSEYLDEPSLLIRSLYLLSAYKRAQANFASNEPEQNELFQEARLYIQKALKYFDTFDSPLLKAKVLFNGGAAHSDDPKGNLNIAIQYYQEAMKIFSRHNEYNNYSRAAIRLGKVWLLQEKYDLLLDLLNEVKEYNLPKKTNVHLLYIEAQYFIAIHEYKNANSIILEAIQSATNLEMKADLDRLNALLKQIQNVEAY